MQNTLYKIIPQGQTDPSQVNSVTDVFTCLLILEIFLIEIFSQTPCQYVTATSENRFTPIYCFHVLFVSLLHNFLSLFN